MKPRLLVVDDEAPARARLRALIEAGALGEVVGEAADGAEALALAAALRPDVVLLDIRMPGMDGMRTARELAASDAPPAVVFCTAYDEHALAAFDAGAVDYLLKPVRANRLAAALQRVLGRAGGLTSRPAVETGGTADAPGVESDAVAAARTHLSATLNGEVRRVPVAEARVLRAEHKYVSVYHPGGVLVLEASLAALEAEFGARFLRVHRNALVARAHISALLRRPGGGLAIRLRDHDEAVEVSRRLAPAVRRALRA